MLSLVAPGSQATILHADLDAFYASVEQLLDPSLRGTPIAVGGSVVLAASYEAKAFGVQGGMPGWRARERCPQLRFVEGHFSEYQRLGDAVMEVFGDFTPLVERMSIDEAFLDVRGSVHLFGAPAEIGAAIRRRVRDELGLPVSVGVATTKHLAKIASQVAKPDGLVVVEAGEELEFLDPLPVRLLWGVGPATGTRLEASGIRTIAELRATSPAVLEGMLGHAAGAKLGSLASNVDPRGVEADRRAKSIGAQSAFPRRAPTDEVLRTTLGFLADRVATRLRAKERAGRTVTVRVRFSGMRSVTRSTTLPEPLASTLTLTEVAVGLARAACDDHAEEREVTLLAVSVSNLAALPTQQLELALGDDADGDVERPVPSTVPVRRTALDAAMDTVRARFGRAAVGYASVEFEREGVPDEFRELAEGP
ncbi:MAG: DNA polymerase IV [Acidimicrobiia bacterium]